MKREIIVTGDGSKTIFLPEMDENYHSGHGALQEALHVFINQGLNALPEGQNEVAVFEMGFGTGLNALLTLVNADETGRTIHYSGIEAYPVEAELIREIGYERLVDEKYWSFFQQMHTLDWNKIHDLRTDFSFLKIHEKVEDYEPEPANIDVVFFDAFGPRAQAAMWDISILEKMYRMLKPGGFLVTYCAQGQFKRDLKALGFTIEALPGPPGKREMTRAHKKMFRQKTER